MHFDITFRYYEFVFQHLAFGILSVPSNDVSYLFAIYVRGLII